MLIRAIEQETTLISYLNLSGVSLGTDDLARLVDSLVRCKYKYLETFEIANNRLEGAEAAKSLEQLITRQPTPLEEGYQLRTLNLSFNKLGNKGVS